MKEKDEYIGRFAAGTIMELAELGHKSLPQKPSQIGTTAVTFCLSSTSPQVPFCLHRRIMAHCVTLAAHGVQLERGESGVQWQQYEEQGISLCFSKIAVCDADCEVKMKDILCYGLFPPFFK